MCFVKTDDHYLSLDKNNWITTLSKICSCEIALKAVTQKLQLPASFRAQI